MSGMGLFSKRPPKPIPKIVVNGLEIFCGGDGDGWDFTYRGVDFVCFDPVLMLPSEEELDRMLKTLEDLAPEMRQRIIERFSDSPIRDSATDGVSRMVDLAGFGKEGTISVSWSGGDGWGDLGVEFVIKDGTIIEEHWGD